MQRSAFLWPKIFVAIRAQEMIPHAVYTKLVSRDIECQLIAPDVLIADISYLQNAFCSTELAIAEFQHVLNLQLSSLSYALGIGSEKVSAFHAAQIASLGREQWVLPWQFDEIISQMPVAVTGVIDKRIPEFFGACGLGYCEQLLVFSKPFLVRRFGRSGEALWFMLRGKSRQLPIENQLPGGNLQWQIALPVRTRSRRALSAHLWNLYSVVYRDLDRLQREANSITMKYRITAKPEALPKPIKLHGRLVRRAQLLEKMQDLDFPETGIAHAGVTHLEITAKGLSHPAGQLDLF